MVSCFFANTKEFSTTALLSSLTSAINHISHQVDTFTGIDNLFPIHSASIKAKLILSIVPITFLYFQFLYIY